MSSLQIVWLRRDLRLHDQAALYHALKSSKPALLLFIFDQTILAELKHKSDKRVKFLHQTLCQLKQELETLGSSLLVKYGEPEVVFRELISLYKVESVFTNHDYEPYARKRDAHIAQLLSKKGIQFNTFKDQCVFEKDEVLKPDGKPYTVFTPYSKRWKSLLNGFHSQSYPTEKYFANLLKTSPFEMPTLASMGFQDIEVVFAKPTFEPQTILDYAQRRDFPSIAGTTRLSLHLRFGTISVRELLRQTSPLSDVFVNELVWRDFYMMILWHFPHVVERAFKPAYDRIRWRDSPQDFEKWCKGQTGYPLVDAGMRELNATGFMHNRVRMVVASFLTKHLLLDWRLGEGYFAEKLLDFDLSANNGGWQWAMGGGCDAAPYFRIFNPESQTQKFDNKMTYIRKWVPEVLELSYPRPMVEHVFARERCLRVYKTALNEAL
ncbi:MAG: deoxyribodipyrimidine photo-lyase [Cytophagales bacterium]|nr:MAG: deoxyribodipyrimidine photo-lyase [Cytophagales bacterium]